MQNPPVDRAETGHTVEELGESGLLARILARLSPAATATVGPGDDAAVLRPRGEIVVTSDTMVEGPDFRRAWHSGFELGWKLAATNLSDVAAMGARPIGLTVSIACPADLPVAYLERLAEGLDAACRTLAPGCGVVGGDLGRAPVLTAAVTALGDLGGRRPVLRSGAHAGDVVAYAGDLGLAGLGLSLLFDRAATTRGEAHDRTLGELWAEHPEALAAQLAPSPPIGLGIEAAKRGATAMMDVSDGLALDAARLGEASGVTVDLDPRRLEAAFGERDGERIPLDAMLSGGEDHGLLTVFPALVRLPAGFSAIGRVRPRSAPLLVGGRPHEPRGWDPYLVRWPGDG